MNLFFIKINELNKILLKKLGILALIIYFQVQNNLESLQNIMTENNLGISLLDFFLNPLD